MSKDFTSGAEPEQLRQLFSLGLEESLSEQKTDRTASLDIFMEKPGSRIGRYKLLRVLGEGGMGIVYLAQQHQPVKRQIAVKIIKPGMDSKSVIARFEAEQQALALMEHPHIARVHDAGLTPSGRPYFVMEYVKGLPITEYCDHHKLTIDNRLNLFLKVCNAIHHAHQKGIIHRDIKPSNILVSAERDEAIPKIIDFGVAKAISQPLTEHALATENSQLLGTPEYMSPEQADMGNEDIDTRSDVYSLGVLLYVLLTGVLPFDSDTLREGGIDHIRQVIHETDPKTPSTRLSSLGDKAKKVAQSRRTEIASLAKKLHKELEWIPLKAMRKERTERYRSASELTDDIENYLKGAPLIAGPLTTGYRIRKFLRRHKALVGGIAAILVVSVIGTIVSVIFALGQTKARTEAERQAKISEAISSFLRKDLLASVSPARSKGRDLTVRSFLDTASENLEGKFEDEPLVEASIRVTLGWIYRELGELKSAESHHERALKIYQGQLGNEHLETLVTIGSLGWVYCDQGRYKEAERLWAEKLDISRRVFGDEHPITLGSINDLAIAYKDLGRYDEAEQLYLRELQIRHRTLDEHNQIHRFIGNLGQVYGEQGRYDEAEALYLKSIELKRHVLGEQHPYTLLFMNFLAGIYSQQGRYDEAEELYLKTLNIQHSVLGEQHPYTLWSIKGLARMYAGQGRYEQAEKLFAEALEGLQNVRGKEHRDTIDLMNGLAEMYTDQYRFNEAESLLITAREIGSRTLGDEHPWTLSSINGLSIIYKEQARYDKAEPLLIQAVEGRRLKLGDRHPHTVESLNNLIALYEAWNKPEKAKVWRAKRQGKS